MSRIVRIGSRESRLAVAQAEIIKQQILRNYPELQVEIVTMKTIGDKILDRSLTEIGGKGLFVKELDRALLEERIDLAVHSLKDLPMEVNEELPVLAYGRREDPRDVLLWKPGTEAFPESGVLGTSSMRRQLQMKRLYPDCHFRGIRGNVQTRMKKLAEEAYDGTILAAAGLKRLGIQLKTCRYFSVEEMIPAAGQGILAVQGRKNEKYEWTKCLQDRDSEIAAKAERRFVSALDGGCTSPVAAYAQINGQDICLTGLYYDEVSGVCRRKSAAGDISRAEQIGEQLAYELKRGGA